MAHIKKRLLYCILKGGFSSTDVSSHYILINYYYYTHGFFIRSQYLLSLIVTYL